MTRTKEVSRDRYKVFIERAGQFYESMLHSFSNGDYDACVSSAVHCGISASDALAVLKLGRKSAAQNHFEAVLLLKEAKVSEEAEKSRMCDKLQELLKLKMLAEYEDRSLSKAEAEKAKALCEKVFAFVKKEISTGEKI